MIALNQPKLNSELNNDSFEGNKLKDRKDMGSCKEKHRENKFIKK